MKFGKEIWTWECKCGNIESSAEPPEECMKCWRLNSFVKIQSDFERGIGGRYED